MAVQTASNLGALGLPALALGRVGFGVLSDRVLGGRRAATAVGLCLAISSLGVITGAPLIRALADRLGSYGPGWIALAGAMAVAVLLLLGVREPTGQAWR